MRLSLKKGKLSGVWLSSKKKKKKQKEEEEAEEAEEEEEEEEEERERKPDNSPTPPHPPTHPPTHPYTHTPATSQLPGKQAVRSPKLSNSGIALLSVAGKVLARILTTRLTPLAEKILPESQCGFRPARGTTDMVFSARQLQEKCREQPKPLTMGFIDLTKAFDSMNCLQISPSITEQTEEYSISAGLRQQLKSMLLLLLSFSMQTTTLSVLKLKMQTILNAFANAYSRLGLPINIRNPQVLYKPPQTEAIRVAPTIRINGVALETVDHFPYLGSHLSLNANIDDEVQYRLRCANSAFGKLRRKIFDDHDLRVNTKIKVYQAIVLPTLLYASETWTTYRRHVKALDKFHQRSLRNISRITWDDRRTNVSVLEEADCLSIEAIIIKSQFRWQTAAFLSSSFTQS
ncbi:uncharacterized protein LOC135205178 [Macrobrachium nipponense]|uniref:uncharacterized protein LOC135205178 n=1 Tax=Macrobrachium nipponense TaxID=159736 RepID=UPI0030C830A3